jgi:tetratricopeptide (TPR) repeat protein
LANRLGDVQLSVKYLEAAVSTSLDPRVQNRDELPLAETYLNIANAHSFLGKFDEAISFAEKAEIYAGS